MTKYVLICALAVSASSLDAQPAPTVRENEEMNLRAYVELLRKDLKRDKVALLTELMQLNPEESSKFWPLYGEYDKALTKLADERIALIRIYADNFSTLTDQKILQVANGLMAVELSRNQLKKDYFQRIGRAVSVRQAARFLQLETQIEKIVDLQILSALPVIEDEGDSR